jgi:hypothetical protein
MRHRRIGIVLQHVGVDACETHPVNEAVGKNLLSAALTYFTSFTGISSVSTLSAGIPVPRRQYASHGFRN